MMQHSASELKEYLKSTFETLDKFKRKYSLPPDSKQFEEEAEKQDISSREYRILVQEFQDCLLRTLKSYTTTGNEDLLALLNGKETDSLHTSKKLPLWLNIILQRVKDAQLRNFWLVYHLIKQKENRSCASPKVNVFKKIGFEKECVDLAEIFVQIKNYYAEVDKRIFGKNSDGIRQLKADIWCAVFMDNFFNYMNLRLSSESEIRNKLKLPVLITGETGTGKDLVAQAIHKISDRRNGQLVAVNCGTLPGDSITSLLSELFGHVKGAYTGAETTRAGAFRLADNGIIFLDEIGDIPESVQVAILRVLETSRFKTYGADEDDDVNVRIITATNRDIISLMREGKFRKDLFYRIQGTWIKTPPLRDIQEDIELILRKSNEKVIDRCGQEGEERLSAFLEEMHEKRISWPGNVRQLLTSFDHYLGHRELDIINELELVGDEDLSRKDYFSRACIEKKPIEKMNQEYFNHIYDEYTKKYPRNFAGKLKTDFLLTPYKYLQYLKNRN